MDTLEGTTRPTAPPSQERPAERRTTWWMIGLIGAIAALLGLAAGAIAFDRSPDRPRVLIAGGGELTPRQEQMVQVADDYIAAWQAIDGDLAASFMTEDGFIDYIAEDWTFRVDDGTLQSRISNGPYASLVRHDPIVVHGDRITLAGTIESVGVDWVSIVTFTSTGDVEIISERIDFWS